MVLLYDGKGNEAPSAASLRREHAPDNAGMFGAGETGAVAKYLSPVRLGNLLRNASAGDHVSYLTLAEEMEERDLHYKSVLFQRKALIAGAPVVIEPAIEGEEDADQHKALLALTKRDTFWQLVFDLMDAVGKGLSVVEIIWDTDAHSGRWEPVGYRWRDQRRYKVDPLTGGGLRLRDGTAEGVPLPPHKYLVHTPRLKNGRPIRGGVAYSAAMAFLFKTYTVRDMHRFLEVAGIPARLGRVPDADWNDKVNGPAKIARFLRAIQKIGSHAAGVVPKSFDVEFLKAATGEGAAGFIRVASWWDQQVSKGVLGQTMTTDDGSSKSQATVHDGVRYDIAAFDARAVSTTINRFLVRPYLDLNWGPQEVYPRLSVTVREKHALEAWVKAVGVAADRGVEIGQAFVRERMGIPDPKPGEALLSPSASQPRGAGANRPGDDPPDPDDDPPPGENE